MRSSQLHRFAEIKAPVHGGTPLSGSLLDFSISVNPFPLPESAEQAFRLSWNDVGIYPDNDCSCLRRELSETFETEPEKLLVTNGSAEAFSLIASVFLGPGCRALIVPPCYSDYRHVSELTGAEVSEYRLRAEDGFDTDVNTFTAEIRRLQPDLIWLCSPNNPTGVIISDSFILAAAEEAGRYGGTVVVDDAYAAFSDLGLSAGCSGSNIIRVRSLTKDFGIPGLRLGFISAAPEVTRVLALQRPCWSVNAPAQAVGAALLRDVEYFSACWERTALLHEAFLSELNRIGVDTGSACGNSCPAFVFFRTPVPAGGRDFHAAMQAEGVRLRDCTSMGAPGFSRAGVKLEAGNRRFLDALQSVIEGERVV